MDVAPDQPGVGPQDSVDPVATPGTYDPSYAGPASVSGGSTDPNGNPNGPGSPEPDDSDAIQGYIKQLLESPIESSLGDSLMERLRELFVDPRLFDDPHVKAALEEIESFLNSAGGSPVSAEDIGTLVGLVETLQTTINEFYTGSNDYTDYSQFVSGGWSTSYDAILVSINKYRELSGDWTSFFNDEALQELELKIKEKITALAEHLMQYGNQLSPQDRERADRELAYLQEMITIYSGGHFESGQNVRLSTLLSLETLRAGNDILLSVVLSFWAARVSKFGPEAAAIATAYSTYTAERARNLKNNYINNWQGESTRENFINTAQAHYESFKAAEYKAMVYAGTAAVAVELLGRASWGAGKIPSAAIKELVQTILKALAATLGIKMADDLHTKLSEGLDDVINGSIDDDYLRVQEGWVKLTDVGLDGAQLINLHALVSKLMKANKIEVPEPAKRKGGGGPNGDRDLRSLTPQQNAAIDEKVRRSAERIKEQHPEADMDEVVAELRDKASKELSGKLQQSVATALRETLPGISSADIGSALRGGKTPADLMDLAMPGVRQSDPDLFDSKVKEFVDRLDQRQAEMLQNWIHWSLELNTPPRVYPPNSPDGNSLWPVTPRFNPSSDPRPSTVTKEIKQGTYHPETGYIKNPSAKKLGSEMSVDPQGRLIDPDTGMPLPDGKYIFAVTPDESMVIGLRTNRTYPHPTLIGGFDPRVKTAGELRISEGRVVEIDNQTGHFQVDYDSLYQAVASLRQTWRAQHPTATGDPFKEILLSPWRNL
jgi:hypothetical protein